MSGKNKTKKKIFLFEVDFDKAFDSINGEYLDSTMEKMEFGNKWIAWIHGCLSSAHTSVLINGTPTKEFRMTKGVRQGDPISSFLFIIAMEGLNVAMNSTVEKGVFQGIKIPGPSPIISHLFYADDALFLGEWSRSNLKNLSRILRCFHVSSGLKGNFHKSKVVGIGASVHETSQWASILTCEAGYLPFTYLGVPVGANMNLVKNWQPIIDKFHAKLSSWKARTLSFGGRLTLIKSVLGNLPTYYLSLFKDPHVVIENSRK